MDLKAYIVRLSFEDIEPEIWRRVILPAGATFNRLHEIIQRVTNFQSYFIDQPYHFFDFEVGTQLVSNNPHMHEEYGKTGFAGRTLKKPTRLKIDALLEAEKTMMYNYDSGDGWRIRVDLEEVVDDYHFGFPVLVAGEFTAPPEDVGGPPGFEAFLQAYHDPDHPDHAHLREWAAGQYYKEYDADFINSMLKSSKYQKTEWDKIDHIHYVVQSDKYYPVEKPEWTAMTPEQEQVIDYIIASTNLYGVVPFDKVVELYNAQNDEPITLVELKQLVKSDDIQDQLADDFVIVDRTDFIHEVIEEFNQKAELAKAVGDKPYYVPPKMEFLRYVDDTYIEQTPEQRQLEELLKSDFGDSIDSEEEIMELVAGLQVSGGNFTPELTRFLERLELPIDKAKRYIPVIIKIANTTRLWENRGHTPNELKPFDQQSMQWMPHESPVTVKTGRNEPCPCGSGKKFKKCCGK